MTIQHPADNGGFAAVPNWIARNPAIPGYAKLVYLVLSSHTGKPGAWEISHRTIAEEAGVSVSTVQRALAALRDLGVVRWTTPKQQPGEPSRGSTYYVTPYASVTDPPGQTDRPPRSEGPTPSVTGTDKEEPREEPREQRSALAATTNEAFEEWWQHYPRKTAKKAAAAAFVKAVKAVGLDPVMRGLQRQEAYLRSEHERGFCPHATTWLNQQRWDDEISPVRQQQQRPSGPPEWRDERGRLRQGW